MQRLLPFFLLALCAVRPAAADTVLVLAFFNDSSASSLDWIGESISQTIREALNSRGLIVLDREDRQEVYRRLSIRPYAHLTEASIIRVAEELDASAVIFGSFELSPAAAGTRGRLRITAATLDTRRMSKGPAFSESGPLEDLATLQSHLAWQILRHLAPELTPTAEQFVKEQPPVRLDAMENYTRGLVATSAEQKHRYFTQAVRLDQGFAQPYFELGRLYWERKDYRLASEWLAKIKQGAPHSMEAMFLLGLCRYYTADYGGAQAALQVVADSVPLNEVFNDLGAAQSRRNLPPALDNFRKALEGDPADPDYHFNVGYALWKRGEFASAAESFRATLVRSPEDQQATWLLGRCLKKAGPRPGEQNVLGLERLKTRYEESAYRQLKAALESKKTR